MSGHTVGLSARTIADFGEQWTRFRDNDGYYGSLDVLLDALGPLLTPEEIRGRRVAEIGSGTGRIVQMLLEAGAAHVVAIEPSNAYEVLVRNLEPVRAHVECIRGTGEALPRDRAFDLVFSIGVLHHIPEPSPVVHAAFEALRPGGRFIAWLYGKEGNAAYLNVVMPLRALTTKLPHAVVLAIATLATTVLQPYIWLCRHLPLPLRGYFTRVFAAMARNKQVLIVYDQLRPAYAKYYSEREARSLLASAGFVDVSVYHRHGYSWTVIGTRPSAGG